MAAVPSFTIVTCFIVCFGRGLLIEHCVVPINLESLVFSDRLCSVQARVIYRC